MAIAVPDELQESVEEGSDGGGWQVGSLPANHRASRCALQTRRMATAVSDELQEKGTQGLHSRVCQVGVLPANRASECALERCLEGFVVLDGHKSVPSRMLICLGGPQNGDCRVS